MPTLPLLPWAPRKGVDHAGWIVECAHTEDLTNLPFRYAPPVIVKTYETSRMAKAQNYAERVATAAAIYDSLRVLDPAAVAGRTVLVVDDVFTSGLTLNATARRLREAGARRVRGVALARQPWRS